MSSETTSSEVTQTDTEYSEITSAFYDLATTLGRRKVADFSKNPKEMTCKELVAEMQFRSKSQETKMVKIAESLTDKTLLYNYIKYVAIYLGYKSYIDRLVHILSVDSSEYEAIEADAAVICNISPLLHGHSFCEKAAQVNTKYALIYALWCIDHTNLDYCVTVDFDDNAFLCVRAENGKQKSVIPFEKITNKLYKGKLGDIKDYVITEVSRSRTGE